MSEHVGRCKSYFQLFPCHQGVRTSFLHAPCLFKTQTQFPSMCS